MPNTKHIVQKDQNLIDVALQFYGSEWQSGLLKMLEYNDLSLATTPAPGTEIIIKDAPAFNLDKKYLEDRDLEVRTGAFVTAPPLAADLLLAIAISQTRIDLSWRDNADNEENYELEISLDGINWSFLDRAPANTEAYQAEQLQPETKYYFRNSAYRDGSSSAYSNIASATTLAADVKYVAVTDGSGTIMTSGNGLLWTERVDLITGGTRDICWGEYGTGRWVAVTFGYMYWSDDGREWNQVNVVGNWKKVIYADGQYVAVSYYITGTTSVLATSPDGEDWTILQDDDIPPGTTYNFTLNAIAFGDNFLIALTYTFSPRVAVVKAVNGDWLKYTAPSGQWTDITFGAGVFVAIGENTGFQSTLCATTVDGETWVSRALPNTNSYTSITYGLGLFVAVSGNDGDSSGGVITSPDGVTWTERAVPNKNYTDVVIQGGRFVAINQDASMQVLTSTDGITWEPLNYGYAPAWKAIAAAADLFAPVLAGEEISSSEIELTWTHGNAEVDGFELQECSDGISWVEIATPGAEDDTENVDELTGGTEYKFRIRAVLGTEKSGWSNVVVQETQFNFGNWSIRLDNVNDKVNIILDSPRVNTSLTFILWGKYAPAISNTKFPFVTLNGSNFILSMRTYQSTLSTYRAYSFPPISASEYRGGNESIDFVEGERFLVVVRASTGGEYRANLISESQSNVENNVSVPISSLTFDKIQFGPFGMDMLEAAIIYDAPDYNGTHFANLWNSGEGVDLNDHALWGDDIYEKSHWKVDEGSGLLLMDSGDTNYDLTMENFTSIEEDIWIPQ